MRTRWRQVDKGLLAELILLAATAPALFFAGKFPAWAIGPALALLAGGWAARRMRLGRWLTPTAADWPLWAFFVVILPMSVWAAPPALRSQFSTPRALVMVWNFCLFWTIVTYASRRYSSFLIALGGFALSGLGIACAALLGTAWLYKLPGAGALLPALPAPLRGVFAGAEEGFHPNQVAGTLLYVFPLLLSVTAADLRARRRVVYAALPWLAWVIWPATAATGAVLVLTQSRSAMLGLMAGLLFMALVNYRWGRVALVVGALAIVAALPFVTADVIDLLGDTAPAEMLGGTMSVENFRVNVWTHALAALADFPLTGMGFGAFRELVRQLYPLQVSLSYDIGHAHNFFLQTGLDFGVPGLVTVVAIYLAAFVQLAALRRWPGKRGQTPVWGRVWATGLAGSLAAQTVYSQTDAVAMGAKTNFMLWYLLALIFGLANYAAAHAAGIDDETQL